MENGVMGLWSFAKRITKLSAVVMFAVTCLACADIHTHVMLRRTLRSPTFVAKTYHADKRFTESERAYITAAIDNINVQSNGSVMTQVVFDLDWDISTPKTRSQDELIVRMQGDSSAVKKQDSELPDKNIVLGWCDVSWNDPSYATRVYVVADRIETSGKFIHVVMHEVLHSLRLQHTKGEKVSVLYWQTLGDFPPVCMSYFDAEELCRVYHCKVDDISYCE